jgi:oxygen-independent coproporphyrinogen III oxidase
LAGIYIHIPFCKQACNYCNFHFSVSLTNKEKIIAALLKEILLSNNFIETKNIETIYFGGGTPSLLSKDELNIVVATIREKFIVADDVEITLEANPDDINKQVLADWKSIGINRLSVGLQSFDEAELTWMNRAHNASQSLLCIDEIQAAGFTNFSVDLIYGSPLQSDETLKNNFDIIAQKNIPHISCYALTVENGTVLNKQIKENKSPDVDTERQAAQFKLLLSMMEANGYEQYEISNFSKKNYRSKHNSSYWQSKPYFGFGPSAHSFDGKNKRRWNVANNSLYIQSIEKNIIPYEEEILTTSQQINEYIMTSLRTVEGIDLQKVAIDFGKHEMERIVSAAKKYLTDNKIIISEKSILLTKKGKFFADGIAADLFCGL